MPNSPRIPTSPLPATNDETHYVEAFTLKIEASYLMPVIELRRLYGLTAGTLAIDLLESPDDPEVTTMVRFKVIGWKDRF